MLKTMSEEVVLNIPADRAWRMYRNDQIMSKINPKMLSNASYVQGDGGVGSLRLFKLGPSNLYYDIWTHLTPICSQ